MEIEFALPNILSGTIKEIYQLNKVIIFSRSLFEFFHPSGGGPTFPQSFQTQFACAKHAVLLATIVAQLNQIILVTKTIVH